MGKILPLGKLRLAKIPRIEINSLGVLCVYKTKTSYPTLEICSVQPIHNYFHMHGLA